jgi:predicted nucleic acid-binding protein
VVKLIIFVDSNILIFSIIKEYPEYELANKKLKEIAEKGKIAVNSIIISETFHKISKLKDTVSARLKVREILKSEYTLFIPIEKNTILKSLDLAVKYRIRINDAVIAQHVLDTKSEGVLTDNTKDFSKVSKLKTIGLK